jgi:N-glycosylase/DNA lyase
MQAPAKVALLADIRDIYDKIRPQIAERLAQFAKVWATGDDFDLFVELVFCLLTPSSRARSAERAIGILTDRNLLKAGPEEEIAGILNIVRFRYRKASYIVLARRLALSQKTHSLRDELARLPDMPAARQWLVSSVKGMGYKEASHFLRNIGLHREIAILDRHILRSLCTLGLIDCVPDHLTARRYEAVESAMREYAERIGIPLSYLDFVLWYRATGEIFK